MKVIDRQLPELADSPGLNPHFMSLNGILNSVVIPFVTISAYHSFTKRVPERQSIRTTLAASRQSILPYESLSVLLLLHNETAEEKRVVASWCSFLHIGETTPAGTKWRGYRADNEPVTKPCIPTAKQFAPGETKKMLAHIDDESPSGEHIFARPGKYLLQGG